MSKLPRVSRRQSIGSALVVAAAASFAATKPAKADFRKGRDTHCPAQKKLAKPRDLPFVEEKRLKRETLAEVHLRDWRNVGDLFLRMRKLTIEPGGFVPTHYHDDRPSIVFVLQGELVEHNSFCSESVTHRAGDWTKEFGPFVGHWWENRGSEPAIVLSADVIPPEYKDAMDKDM